jgi:hypothetical protein
MKVSALCASPLDKGRVHNLILHQSTCNNNMVPSHFDATWSLVQSTMLLGLIGSGVDVIL